MYFFNLAAQKLGGVSFYKVVEYHNTSQDCTTTYLTISRPLAKVFFSRKKESG